MAPVDISRRDPARGTKLLLLATTLVLALTACTSSPDDEAADEHPSSTTFTTAVDTIDTSLRGPTHAQCRAAPGPAPGVGAMQEIGGPGLYGLLFTEYPIRRRTEAKIAWRVAASGPVDILARGPNGRTLEPAWGPEAHSGSSWDRPGSEWGTGFRFPSAGCWQVVADTDDKTLTAAVRVV